MIWAAPSMWIERIPVLLANKLELWPKFGLSFNRVQLKVCNGGQETLDIDQNKFEIGEIGLFPFVAHNKDNYYKLIGSSFIKQLDHYIVYKTDTDKIKNVGILSNGSCDSYLLDRVKSHREYKEFFDKDINKIELKSEYGNYEMLNKPNYIDAMFLVEPYLSKALSVNNDNNLSILVRMGELYPRFQWNALFASQDILNKDPTKIWKMMEVYKHSVGLMSTFQTDPNIQKALREIAKDEMDISGKYLFSGLKRGMERWEMDYTKFDVAGAQSCLHLMTQIGISEAKYYRFDEHYFNLEQRSKL